LSGDKADERCKSFESAEDFVPKIDAEFWKKSSEEFSKVLSGVLRRHDEVRKGVAREIFEEIERLLSIHFCSCLPKGATEHYDYYEGDLADAIAELKKKYTENKE
jgi:hypothetical protein